MNAMQFPKGQGFWSRAAHTPFRDWLRGRVTGRLNIDAAIGTYGLPESCVAVVREVARKTRLWRLEKVEVAHELSAHFRDGLDAGRTDAELIADFGDAKQAAKLIRRAKIRCRPLAWHASRWIGWGMGGFVAVYLVLIGLFMLRSPDVRVNYLHDINAAAEAVAAQDRAWPLYREAMIKAGFHQQESEASALFSGKPTDENMDRKAHWLHQHATEMDMFRHAASLPSMGLVLRCGFDPQDKELLTEGRPSTGTQFFADPYADNSQGLISVTLPNLGYQRRVGFALATDMKLAAQEGDQARAVADFRAIRGLAGHISQTVFIINGLVAASIMSTGEAELADVIKASPDTFTTQELATLAHAAASWDVRSLIRRDMESESLSFRDVIQRVYSDDGIGGGRLTFQGVQLANELTSNPSDSLIANKTAIAGLLPVIAYAAADRTEMTAKHEQLINEDARAMVEPMWRTDVHTSDEELRTWDVLKKARYFLISSFLPGSDLRITAAQSQARSDGLLIGLALTAYKRENQRWPATLSELSPRFLPTVPVDPVTGEALHYRLTADGPLVYSVGVNRRDDGGRPTPIPGNALRWDSAKLEAAREGTEFDGDWRMWPLMKDTEGK